jgi:importin subunit alpha-1
MALQKNSMWAIQNLCRGGPAPRLDLVALAVPVLAQTIWHPHDNELLRDALWAISYLTNEYMQEILNANVVDPLLRLVQVCMRQNNLSQIYPQVPHSKCLHQSLY